MKSVLLSFALLTLLNLPVFSQIANLNGNAGSVMREQRYAKVDGSPFLYEDYKKAIIYDVDDKPKDAFVKYDTYKGSFEVFNDGNPLILDAREYPKITFNFFDEEENVTVVKAFQNGFDIEGFHTSDYFQVIRNGKVKVLKMITTAKIDEDEASYGGINNVSSRFIRKERYYLVKPEEPVVVFKKISKGAVLKAFNENRLKNYTQKERLKLKTETELIMVADYYESLEK